jgi:hypothetical protein
LDLPARGGAKHASSPLLVAHHRAARRPAPRRRSGSGQPGRLDPGFGTGGKTTTSFAGDAGDSAAVLQNGKVVAAGFAVTGATTDFALTRGRPNGSVDPSFGNHGRVTTDFAGGVDDARALVMQGGKLVAAGGATTGSGPDFVLARYLS